MTIIDILRTVARFRRLAVLVAVMTMAVGAFVALSPADSYRASSTILVQPRLASGQAVSVQVVDFLVPSFVKTVETRALRAGAAENVPDAVRSASVSVATKATTGTGILTIEASSTDREAVAPWADALAEELLATIESDFVDLAIIDTALAPSSPYAPARGVILAVSALLAMVVSVLTAVVASAVRGRGDGASELRERFGATVLGEIPRVRSSLSTLTTAELIEAPGADRVVEALQTLRANVTIALAEREHPWLVVTSSEPGEGKSFVSTSLAFLLASVSRPTILVDGDSRRPTANRRLGTPIGVGLAAVGPDDLRHALQATQSTHLRFLGAGTPDRHPAEIASTHLPHLLRQAAPNEVVIIDSPPLPVAAETIIYASGAGAVLLVVDARRRDLARVEQVITTLQDRDVTILGVVINRSRRKVRGGYYAQSGGRRTSVAPPTPRPPESRKSDPIPVPASRLAPTAAPAPASPPPPSTEAPPVVAPPDAAPGPATPSVPESGPAPGWTRPPSEPAPPPRPWERRTD